MTPNKEDYLKCIYELGQSQVRMTNKQIAEKMQFSAPAVSEMMKKLLAEGLVFKDTNVGYGLSQEALKMVADLYRKHRLIEVSLVKELKYSPEEVHEEAEILEHAVSTHFIDRLDQLLGFPTTCPHGGTIPKAGEPLVERYSRRLSDVTELRDYRLMRVHDFYQLLQYLDQHHLEMGDSFSVVARDDFSKTLTLQFKGKELALPFSIASQLYVEDK
ncbi:metal-dependent transcriptional regulator [Streptococcus sp. X13SY08]|uniref:metal-dependent transcriptional regulator n=1 Tax=Streptococcus sp. X13SY08 TaxID=1676616 RepID=UPI00066FF1DC|nr:metal-dependent transcriptional regulator [Streptococcus sp. X13SY08]